MIQKCSLFAVTEVFFKEPTKIHFIREISRKVKLAPTSIRKHIQILLKEGMIVKKKGAPFDGFIANRDTEKFRFYKRARNLASLFELKQFIEEELSPQEIRIFGSYSRGEDIEESDIDILIVSKVKKELKYKEIEKNLERKIHCIFVSSLKELDKPLQENILRGWVI